MKRDFVLKVVVSVCLFSPTVLAQAEEKGEPAVIRLSHGVLRYDSFKSKQKEDGKDTVETDVTGATTFPAGIEIAAFVHGYSFYAYPLEQGSASIWLGKAIGSNMEAGVTAKFNTLSVKDGPEESRNSIGGYYFFTTPLSSLVTFELDANPYLIMDSSKSDNGAPIPVETTVDTNGFGFYLDLLGVIPIAKNFEYVFGLDYKLEKYEEKTKTGGTSVTNKVDTSNLGLILAKFRYFI